LQSNSEIVRIVIKSYHPSAIRIRQKEIKWAIALDNAINLALAMAGLEDVAQTNYFTEHRTCLNKKPCRKRRSGQKCRPRCKTPKK